MVKVFPDIESLNNFAAEKFVEIANEAIKNSGIFTVALSGGSTPKELYRLLASEKFRNQINWEKVYFFFGDERNVPPDDEASNFRMGREYLFLPLKISDENVFRWETKLENAGKIAEQYERTIKEFFNSHTKPPAYAGGSDKKENPSDEADGSDRFPRFDLILLGLGADGHTASLFPFTEAVRNACVSGRSKPIAIANYVKKLNTTRLTFTFPTINNASNIIFLVTGAEKAEALREVLQGEYDPEKFPAQKVKPNHGNLLWLIDSQAARLLR